MSYNPNIPNATDLLSNSQGQIKTNFQTANTSFGVDHYSFDNGTASNGFHNKVTTPLIVGGVHPTTVNEPKLYAMQDSVNAGILQYSRGPNNAVPSPVTCLHSPSTAIFLGIGASTNILDFTNITGVVLGSVYAANIGANNQRVEAFIRWRSTGPFLYTTNVTSNTGSLLDVQVVGNILVLVNTSGSSSLSNVYWTLRFHRMGA